MLNDFLLNRRVFRLIQENGGKCRRDSVPEWIPDEFTVRIVNVGKRRKGRRCYGCGRGEEFSENAAFDVAPR